MILRLLRARVLAGEAEHLRQLVRDEGIRHALQMRGLVSFQPALRSTGDGGVELIIASTWSGFDDLAAAARDLDQPLTMPPGIEAMITESRAEHYELAIGEARSMPLREGKLRLTRIPIRSGAEAAYYKAVRRWSDRLLDESGMVAFTLGRRVIGRQDEIVAVQVWQDEATLLEAAGSDLDRPMGESELSGFWAADPAIEHFDTLTATEPRADAPAVLLVDNERRYVHATPAAARLSGHSLARLLTMRVDDVARASDREAVAEVFDRFIATGEMHGPFVLKRPDGSEIEVQFTARANTPWPGSHASFMVPTTGGTEADLDLDAALVEAGLVARYAPAGG